ncbi:hypothetical protein BKA64DRAFT_648640 [Cadophora sp. MPI-SDFR-AT-0126]|nr:hypothetical protein BKA64DRAFT_648640 [Leotiomycetes sp. MPI-SDFR-AT-0126]
MALASEPPVLVILDVGAQVLELGNEEVARKWLRIVPPPDAQATIYVDERDEICVISRTGLTEPLQISPFTKFIDRCLVYLDEAHTRGTDLKMLSNSRAIVTLGPDLTKDRLAQGNIAACMRLRKLVLWQDGRRCHGSVRHPPLLHLNHGIYAHFQLSIPTPTTMLFLEWQNTKKSLPLLITQGVRHYKQREAYATLCGLPTDPFSILEAEAQPLVQRSGPGGDKSHERAIIFENVGQALLSLFQGELDAIRDKCQQFGLDSFLGVNLQEEEERELQPENEREQQVERPNRLPPQAHQIHKDVRDFATTGAFLICFQIGIRIASQY